MRIASPCEITSRLLPGLRVADGTISIEYAGSDADGRTRYRWYLDIPAGEFSGDDLKSGCQGGNLQSGLESLISFLSACGEALAYSDHSGHESENADLFPRYVAEWAAYNRDELSIAALELEEGGQIISE